MGGRTPEGTSLDAIVTPILAPTLSSQTWQAFEYEIEIPAAWDAAGITLSISFSKNVPLHGVTHFAYLDNIVLQQIPEPSTLALLAAGGALLLLRTLRQARRGNTS
jgi:hypothetical protein